MTKPFCRRWKYLLRTLLVMSAIMAIITGGIYLEPHHRARQLAKQLADEPDYVRRAKIAEALLALGEPAFKPTVKLLKHQSARVRWNAVTILGRINDERAIPHLIEALLDDAVVKKEFKIVYEQGARPGPSTDKTIRKAYTVTTIAGAAFYQIMNLKDDRLLYPLVLAFKQTKDTTVSESEEELIKRISRRSVATDDRLPILESGDILRGVWEANRHRFPLPPRPWLPAIRELEKNLNDPSRSSHKLIDWGHIYDIEPIRNSRYGTRQEKEPVALSGRFGVCLESRSPR